jgi:hypothetical protein
MASHERPGSAAELQLPAPGSGWDPNGRNCPACTRWGAGLTGYRSGTDPDALPDEIAGRLTVVGVRCDQRADLHP